MNTVYRTARNITAVGLLLLLVLSIGLMGAEAQSGQGLELGEPMPLPDREMKSASGPSISLGEAAGENGTVVVFWANTCPWVERYEDRMLNIAQNFQPKGIAVVAVNPNDPNAYPEEALEEMRRRANSEGYPFSYLVDTDGELARAFGASRTPQVFLFNADRELVYRGAIDDNPRSAAGVEKPYLRSALDALHDNGTIANKTTKAFGCTIKW